jgi:chemotaxis protein methyltransferase CheR
MADIELSPAEFNLLRGFIRTQCGIDLEEGKSYLVESSLQGVMVKWGCMSFYDLYLRAKQDEDGRLRDEIADAVTTKETFWFRDGAPFTILKELVLPKLCDPARGRGRGLPIRVWSAGCSTGQEPYSIAMTILDHVHEHPKTPATVRDFQVIATDISPAALRIAKTGRYDPLAMSRGLDDGHRDRYFRPQGRTWVVSDEVRDMVVFRQHNLLDPVRSMGTFDVIFFRNVAIYLSDEVRKSVFSRLRGALSEGGYLFLGSTESHLFREPDFDRIDHAAGVCFRPARRGASE